MRAWARRLELEAATAPRRHRDAPRQPTPDRAAGARGATGRRAANAAQNALSSDYTSVSDGFILVLTIIFWSYTLNWLGYKFPRVQHFLSPPPLLLVKDGQLNYRNLRRELITDDELMSQLRKQGIEDINKVKRAYMESDGSISAIERDSRSQRGTPKRRLG